VSGVEVPQLPLVIAAAVKVMFDLRVFRKQATPRGENSAQQ